VRTLAAFYLGSCRDPFPPCRVLRGWPANYPVGDLADLDDEEAAEVDPARFVFSDAELEGWRTIVRALLDEMEGVASSCVRSAQSSVP
jgi:hypothetical protein